MGLYRAVPPDRFPFTLRLLDAATREVVWAVSVTGPGRVPVPAGREIAPGRLLIAQCAWPDGAEDEEVVAPGELLCCRLRLRDFG